MKKFFTLLFVSSISLHAHAGEKASRADQGIFNASASTFSRANCQIRTSTEDGQTRVVVLASDRYGEEVIAGTHGPQDLYLTGSQIDTTKPYTERQLRIWARNVLGRAQVLGYCK